MTSRLIAALDRIPQLDPTYICLNAEDYNHFPAPWWTRATDAWQAEFIARKKARPALDRPIDLLLVSGWEMAVAFRDVARLVPSAAVLDAVPATINAQLRQRGFRGLKRWLSYRVHHHAFAEALAEFDLFLPKGSDCANSLIVNYGVTSNCCYTTLAPQDLGFWRPKTRKKVLPFRLLFVGNDFVRKGGQFLLTLFTQHLADKFTLTIASNDPILEQLKLPPGARWLRGKTREQLLDVYHECDIFIFPTQQDFMPEVLSEALAAGLPCLANDVDGIRDVVCNRETGFLIPYDASTETWAEQLNHFVADPAELDRMSLCARRFAEERLNLEQFERLMANVIRRLRAINGANG
jgi:glycosyltransferase involved in cell wall biosynthesis